MQRVPDCGLRERGDSMGDAGALKKIHLVMVSYATLYLYLDALLCIKKVTNMAHFEVEEGTAGSSSMSVIRYY